MTAETTTPSVWIACLAAYNNGCLHGRWVEVTSDPDDLHDAIKTMLEASPIQGAEEWAFHDYEGFGPVKIGEYDSVERICKIAEGVEEHGEPFLAFIDAMSIEDTDDIEEAIRHRFSDSFRGKWDSLKEFAESEAHEIGLGGIPGGESLEMESGPFRERTKVNVIEMLEGYIDWDKVAREAEMHYTAVEVSDGVLVFSPE